LDKRVQRIWTESREEQYKVAEIRVVSSDENKEMIKEIISKSQIILTSSVRLFDMKF
jgi:hypothetical protein